MESATDLAPDEFVRTRQDYLALLKRRRPLLFGVIACVFLLGTAVAVLLPPAYESVATILIEQPEVPRDLVESTVTSYAEQRIEMIKYRVMTSENLSRIMNRFGLYEDLRKSAALPRIVDKFREDITIETIEARVLDPRSRRATQATIAFTLGYRSQSPSRAQQVASELVTLFLAENMRERQSQAAATTAFLSQEAQRLAERIKTLEAKIAIFKTENVGRLPQELEINIGVMDQAERDLARIDRRIEGLRERRNLLQSEMKLVSASITADMAQRDGEGTPLQRLAMLREKLSILSQTLGPRHPQLINLKNEIAALERALQDPSQSVPGRNMKLAVLRDGEQAESILSLNPVYLQIRSQLRAADVELRELESERESLADRIRSYESRMAQAPEVERAYRALIRDYDNAQRKYNETKDKQLAAELSQALEAERKGERFVLIEPPQLPMQPAGPAKWLLVLGSLVLAVVSGVGLMLLIDMFDERIYMPRQLAVVTGEMPLQVVPYIQTPAEQRRGLALRTGLALSGIGIAVGGLAAVHLLVVPLDLLGEQFMAFVRAKVQVPQL